MTALDAVVFDLYGTLVHEFPRADFYGVVCEMALDLEVDADAFQERWTASAPERQTGRYRTVEENVVAICRELGREPDRSAVARAMARRDAMYERHFRARPGAEETLRSLRSRGVPVGLVSMCAPDTPALWRATPLAAYVDVAVFSNEVGLRKPDPAIYLVAVEGLRVEPTRCLYVGDGAYGELTGAAAVGMHVVQIRDPDEAPGTALRPDAEEWSGPAIDSLREVLSMVAS